MSLQMEFDFTAAAPVPVAARQERGARNHRAGLAAEDCVARDYERRGYAVIARRWRGRGGELDLVVRNGDGVIFVEVKKSRDFDGALAHLRPRQMRRWFAAGDEFCGTLPNGSLTDRRFDVALVDRHGMIRVIEAVWMH